MSRGLRIRIPGAVEALEAKCERGPAIPRHPDFEALLAFQMRALKLPEPQTQLQFISGRKYSADFAWPAFRLVVEVQGGIWRRRGGAHSGGTAIERDIEKQQLALLNDWQLFPVTTDQVKRGEAVQLVELALRKKGWSR